MKLALCCGINDYPGTGNDLSGCINDANDWSNFLKNYFLFDSVTTLLDSNVTKNKVISSIQMSLNTSRAGDTVVFTYSGHGTQVLDYNDEEIDGYDEALYLYDGTLSDDELRKVLDTAKAGVHLVVILDSCFSGTATRKIFPIDAYIKPKFIRNPQIVSLPQKSSFVKSISENEMVEVLISGCSDNEYSYDAYINNKYNGAFTANAIPSMKLGITYNEFYTELRKYLPGEYPQTPQLEGSDINKNKKLFEPILSSVPEEPEPTIPDEENNEESNNESKLKTICIVLAVLVVIGIIILCF